MRRSRTDVDQEVAAIGNFSRVELAERWTKIYGCPPPVGVRRELLAFAVAWHMQAKRLGGHSIQTRKAIALAVRLRAADVSSFCGNDAPASDNALGKNLDEVRPAQTFAGASATRTLPRPGSRLIREWNGHTNVVDVVEKGFQFNGEIFQSLSAIARKITGAHWSGPRFFGL